MRLARKTPCKQRLPDLVIEQPQCLDTECKRAGNAFDTSEIFA